MSLTIKCIDLFCGCGGMSLGFEASGFNIVAGIDNWKAAIRVYEKNFDHPIIEKGSYGCRRSYRIDCRVCPPT